MAAENIQLPLELKLPVKAQLQDYIAENRQTVIASLQHLLEQNNHNLVFLSGSGSSGKTHLLSALCQLADQQQLSVIYLPLKEHASLPVDICEGLEQADLVCLDDIDRIAGRADWEQALFHLFNRLRDNRRRLLVSAAEPAVSLDINLPDLKSRLAWGVSHTLKTLSDNDKKKLLQQRALQQGMDLPDETVNYLMNHHSRHTGDLINALDQLERASMAAQRKLTVPFIKDVLSA